MARHGKPTVMKRVSAPRVWKSVRKMSKYILRVSPGPHPSSEAVPLLVLLRDILKLGRTLELRKVIKAGRVKVDSRVVKDKRFPVGLMDTVSVDDLHYRVVLDRGKLDVVEIDKVECDKKFVKVIGKHVVKGGKIQYKLSSGRVLLSDKNYDIGSTLLIELPSQKVLKTVEQKKGSKVLITKGKHAGEVAVLQDVIGGRAVLNTKDMTFQTPKDYIFVIDDSIKVVK